MVKIVNRKIDFDKLIISSLDEKKVAFDKDSNLIYLCKKVTNKSLFSHTQIIKLLNGYKLTPEQVYNLLLELKDSQRINYINRIKI